MIPIRTTPIGQTVRPSWPNEVRNECITLVAFWENDTTTFWVMTSVKCGWSARQYTAVRKRDAAYWEERLKQAISPMTSSIPFRIESTGYDTLEFGLKNCPERFFIQSFFLQDMMIDSLLCPSLQKKQEHVLQEGKVRKLDKIQRKVKQFEDNRQVCKIWIAKAVLERELLPQFAGLLIDCHPPKKYRRCSTCYRRKMAQKSTF